MLTTIDTAFKHHKYYRIFLKWTPEIKKFKEEKRKKNRHLFVNAYAIYQFCE